MDSSNWDLIDWLKAAGYLATVGSLLFGFVGNKRSAASFGTASTILGLVTTGVDLFEPPKHHGSRAVFNPQFNCYVCTVCGCQVDKQPRLGFE